MQTQFKFSSIVRNPVFSCFFTDNVKQIHKYGPCNISDGRFETGLDGERENGERSDEEMKTHTDGSKKKVQKTWRFRNMMQMLTGSAYNVCNVHVSQDVRELEKTSVVEEMLHAASMIEFELF